MKCDFCNGEFPAEELETLENGYLCVSCKTYIKEIVKRINIKRKTVRCDFCEKEFPESELETVEGALHDSGDPEEFHVCETCAAWIDENTGRRVEK